MADYPRCHYCGKVLDLLQAGSVGLCNANCQDVVMPAQASPEGTDAKSGEIGSCRDIENTIAGIRAQAAQPSELLKVTAGTQQKPVTVRELERFVVQYESQQRKLEILTKALEHYADAATWSGWRSVNATKPRALRYCPLNSGVMHGYDIARKALDDVKE